MILMGMLSTICITRAASASSLTFSVMMLQVSIGLVYFPFWSKMGVTSNSRISSPSLMLVW